MQVTFLGHAGFLVETAAMVLVADPWLSPSGAFDAAWFQFPMNHHLAALVQERLADESKARYVYLSHEHRDHYDRAFLDSIQCRDFTVIVPKFARTALVEEMSSYECRELVVGSDGEELSLVGGRAKLYIDDSELNRDSAMLLGADGCTFLDLNDCRISDRLPEIRRKEGRVDVFACQFSGANWHPVCYEYNSTEYERISTQKVLSKFNSVAKAISTLSPRVYLASAGPPCFLDPDLFSINLERVNTFPQAWEFLGYLDQRLAGQETSWPLLMPGDVLDVPKGSVVESGGERVGEADRAAYLQEYARRYAGLFAARSAAARAEEPGRVLAELAPVLREKLDAFELYDRVPTFLFFGLSDLPERLLKVDFARRDVEEVAAVDEPEFYRLLAPASQVRRVLDGVVSWEDFAHTFRLRLARNPDVYHTSISAFIRLDPSDLERFCEKMLAIEARQERILKEADGARYVVDRYCPHQGGDLAYGWIEEGRYLVCPRHGWRYDLENEGACPNNAGTVHARRID